MKDRAAAKGRRLLLSVAVCFASTLLHAPAAANADALPLYIGDPTANEKVASGIFLSLGEGNVKRSLSLATEKRWGNDYMHARYYSPNLGRFVSVDPVGGEIGSSQSWNRYSYTLNNPVKGIDPDGRTTYVFFSAPAAEGGGRFGHVGMVVDTPTRRQGHSAGSGTTFAHGISPYVNRYLKEGRSVTVHRLNLSDSQEASLADAIAARGNWVPGERNNNCATACGDVLRDSEIVPSWYQPEGYGAHSPASLEANLYSHLLDADFVTEFTPTDGLIGPEMVEEVLGIEDFVLEDSPQYTDDLPELVPPTPPED